MQAVAGGIQHNLGHIFAQRKPQLVQRAVLGQRLHAVPAPQALYNGLFYNALACGHAGERTGKAAALHRKGGVCGHQFLPRNGRYAVEQLVERVCRKGFEQNQHPLGTAAPQIGCSDHLRPAAKRDAAVRNGNVPCADAFKIKGGGAFCAKITGGDEIVFQNRSSSQNSAFVEARVFFCLQYSISLRELQKKRLPRCAGQASAKLISGKGNGDDEYGD